MTDIFAPRGLNKREGEPRIDGWVGGRADTWHGHYLDVAASRADANASEMMSNRDHAALIAKQLRETDAAIVRKERAFDAGLALHPLTPAIGMEVHGIDMADPTDAQVKVIWDLVLEHKVVFFRDQGHITQEQHMAFAKRFADIGLAYGRQQSLAANPTVDQHPEILKLYSDEARPFAASNWHSDVTWSNRPPLGSILLSRKSPEVGGDTMFADSYAHWHVLSPVLREFLEGRFATHGRAGRDEVEHPICRTHPETGRKALYINPTFTNAILGMEPADSARLLAQLYAKMYSTPEHCCRFRWREGSVAMWDNRSCQHYAVADFWPHDRFMERVTLLDRNEDNEVPFWLDVQGERHYGRILTSEEEISTPIGGSTRTIME